MMPYFEVKVAENTFPIYSFLCNDQDLLSCHNCSLRKLKINFNDPIVPWSVADKADGIEYIFIGQNPGGITYDKEPKHFAFGLGSGKELVKILHTKNILNKSYITNLVKCRIDTPYPNEKDIQACSSHLKDELFHLKHIKKIFSLGKFTQASIIKLGIESIYLPHPGSFFHNIKMKDIFISTLQKSIITTKGT